MLPVAREAIGALDLGARVSAVEVQTVAGWWVYIPPLKNRAEVERKVAELTEQGVDEYFTVENGDQMRNAISLGIFRTEEAANNYLQALRDKGVRSALVGRRDHRVTQTAFLVRNPDPAISARMAELATRFPGTEAEGEGLPRLKQGTQRTQRKTARTQRTRPCRAFNRGKGTADAIWHRCPHHSS